MYRHVQGLDGDGRPIGLTDMCIDMRIDVCIDMCIDMRIDMCIDMYIDMLSMERREFEREIEPTDGLGQQ